MPADTQDVIGNGNAGGAGVLIGGGRTIAILPAGAEPILEELSGLAVILRQGREDQEERGNETD